MKESIRKLIQAISVFQWVLTFILMGIFFSLLFLYLLFTSYWPIPVLYITWMFIDRDTPSRGGRRVEWYRKSIVWKNFRDYFPVKLVQTSALSPDRNYILGCHPHGIICAASICNFATDATGFSELNPGVRSWLATLSGVFRLPIYRELIMFKGFIPVSKDSLKYKLTHCGMGNAVCIIVGGSAEALQSSPGKHVITLGRRKGFVRLALEQGADLVPVYCFGENDLYEQIHLTEGSWGWKLQLFIQKRVGVAPCLFKGTGVFRRGSWGFNPFPRPLTSVVGKPIHVPHCPVPSEEEVSHYHKLYIERLQELFNEHKVSCGLSANDVLQIT